MDKLLDKSLRRYCPQLDHNLTTLAHPFPTLWHDLLGGTVKEKIQQTQDFLQKEETQHSLRSAKKKQDSDASRLAYSLRVVRLTR